jgi:hypothetical protein
MAHYTMINGTLLQETPSAAYGSENDLVHNMEGLPAF